MTECPFDASVLTDFKQECLNIYISKLLGLAILGGSVAVKLPQVWNIASTQNVEGLSPLSFYSEVLLFGAHAVYNFRQGNPFTSYGESCAIFVQNILLVVLLWKYMRPAPSNGHQLAVTAALGACLALMFALPADFMFVLPLLNLPLTVAARVPQIAANFQQRSTGQLSLITTTLNFLGGLARVFTTLHEIGSDWYLLGGLALGLSTNGILLAQIIYYSFIRAPKQASVEKAKPGPEGKAVETKKDK